MHLYEFQAKELLARSGIAVPRGKVVDSGAAAEAAARELGCQRFAVKAQILGGDRAAHGGVVLASSPAEVRSAAEALIGRRLVTSQTGPRGSVVKLVYVEEAIEDVRHLYAAVALDRAIGRTVLLASDRGGDDIEQRAARDRSLIRRAVLTIGSRSVSGDFDGMARQIGLAGAAAEGAANLFRILADTSVKLDALMLEVNPLALGADGRLTALDAKLAIDDNALHRQPELAQLRNYFEGEERGPAEQEAQRHHINYLPMEGSVGMVVNGAGLALATLDLICDAGGTPANFMDIRTTASSLDIAYGLRMILTNRNARSVLVNIHGGGMQRCDTVAEGIGIAMRKAERRLPLVICMAGNNADFARTVLANTGVRYIACKDAWEAAQTAVRLAAGEAQ
ncbi:MAG TPA: ATP-grasp domain-containing protein [Hyphomicrobiaceae bacterium]|nr:ATP-grasp domain-containing protein [Hyphomicrobiaceae bacterium]